MSSLTLAIDEKLLREARIKAVKEGTSVNEICRKAIEEYVGHQSAGERQAALLQATFEFAKTMPAAGGPLWEGRDALYAVRLDELERRRRR
jgi:hypothetical protein